MAGNLIFKDGRLFTEQVISCNGKHRLEVKDVTKEVAELIKEIIKEG